MLQGVAIRERVQREEIAVRMNGGTVSGTLALPVGAYGLVLVVSEGASDYLTDELTRTLNRVAIGALITDLLTSEERADLHAGSSARSNVELLGRRLAETTDWLASTPATADLRLGYFGTGVASAAVLAAAAQRPALASAVVLCDGRPLLAAPALPQVRSPTLLITATPDVALARLNLAGFRHLLCAKQIEILPNPNGAAAYPATFQSAIRLAREWFERYLVVLPPERPPDTIRAQGHAHPVHEVSLVR